MRRATTFAVDASAVARATARGPRANERRERGVGRGRGRFRANEIDGIARALMQRERVVVVVTAVVGVLALSTRHRCAVLRRIALLGKLTARLARYGTSRWVVKLCGLVAYSIILAPAFLRVAWYYATSKNVKRGIAYGANARNTLDLYFPEDCAASSLDFNASTTKGTSGKQDDERRPVVIFITGGMWIIGYKAWGALLAQRLARRGIIVASLDYRNFPQGTVGDMIADVSNGISWVLERLDALGGDKRKVVVVGQSAGAHLAATAIIRQSEWVARSPNIWSPGSISKFIGISGVYAPDDAALIEHFHRQGLYKNVFWSIMEAGFTGSRAAEALPRSSPVSMLREREVRDSVHILPPVMLCHGEADASAPPEQSRAFATALRAAGVKVDEKYYAGKTHTDPFVTDPILGRDILLDDIANSIFGKRVAPFDEKPLMPRVFVALARKVVPF